MSVELDETYVDDTELYEGSGEENPGILPAVGGDEQEPWPVGGGGEEGEEEDGGGGEEVEGGECAGGGGHRVQEGQQRYRRHWGGRSIVNTCDYLRGVVIYLQALLNYGLHYILLL